ncbi:MAG: hypothetical protein ACRDUB_22630, partial [Mycobacterium sp.]
MTDDDQLARRPGDDVDSRAAELMARLAARQGRPDAALREPVSSAEPVEPTPPAEPPPVEPPPAPAAPQLDRPDDVRPGPPTNAPAESDPVETPEWPQTPIAVEPPPSDSTQRIGRRMAAPPWQPAADPSAEDFPARGDRKRDASSGADEPPGRGRPVPPRGQPADPRPAFRPDWHSGPPPTPPPGWNGPPPPPGWPGPPPWMPPRRDWVPPTPPSPGDEPERGRHAQPPGRPSPGQRRLTGPDSVGTGPRDATRPPAARPFDDDSPGHEQLTPQFGWRRVLYRATRGRVNPGVSQKDREQQDLLEQIRQPIASDFRIAVLSIKGGVG